MKIELKPNETVDIAFCESDGVISVSFGETSISVNADLPDSYGRHENIYLEDFSSNPSLFRTLYSEYFLEHSVCATKCVGTERTKSFAMLSLLTTVLDGFGRHSLDIFVPDKESLEELRDTINKVLSKT